MKRTRANRHQANDKPLRRVLAANAAFSAVSGLFLTAAPSRIAEMLFAGEISLFGLGASTLLLMLGLGLLTFAGFVAFTARQDWLGLGQVKLIILADLLWVIDSAVLLAAFPALLTPFGLKAVLVTAVIVLVLAIEQALGIAMVYQGKSRVTTSTRGESMTVTASLRTRASAERVWQVMSDQAGYADVADNLSRSEVLEGQGLGMVRRCTDTKSRSWRETCTKWDEGRAFAFRVHTEAADYPYPIAALTGEWSLDLEPGKAGTEIKMVFELQARAGLVNRLLLKAMSASFARVCDRLLRRWSETMEAGDPDIAPRQTPTRAAGTATNRLSATS